MDATPLFLILIEQYCEWTADIQLFQELQGNVKAALEWMDSFEQEYGDSYIRYQSPSFVEGLVNQGWKDAGNSIVTESSGIAHPPIVLCEVQAMSTVCRSDIL